jgi:hypothetical protein
MSALLVGFLSRRMTFVIVAMTRIIVAVFAHHRRR